MNSPVTQRDRELLAMQPVTAQFSVAFDNNAVWKEFDGECSCCEKTLRREFVRGLVSRPIHWGQNVPSGAIAISNLRTKSAELAAGLVATVEQVVGVTK